jgi:hypothetical protein
MHVTRKNFNWCNWSGNLRKYVNELYAMYDNVAYFQGGFSYHTILYLRIKLEWKGSGGWKTAGEYRFISYNFTSNISFRDFNFYTPYQFKSYNSNGFIERNRDLNLVLFEGGFNYFNGTFTPNYDVEIKGSITQAISNKVPTATGGGQCNTWTVGCNGIEPCTLW